MSKLFETAPNVMAEGGEVIIDGRDGLVCSMTPEAAADTGDRLLECSTKAAGQRAEARRLEEERRQKGF